MLNNELEIDVKREQCNSIYKESILSAQLEGDIIALFCSINSLLFSLFANLFLNTSFLSVLLLCYIFYCFRSIRLDLKSIRISKANVNCNCKDVSVNRED